MKGQDLPMNSRFAPFALVFTLSAGCAAPPPPRAQPPAATVDAGDAPYPYTVDEIRSGCHERIVVSRMKAGQPATRERWTFGDVDADTARITTTPLDAEGKETGTPATETVKWADLHEHARFPLAKTTLTEESVTIPAGTFVAARYFVRDGETTKTYWFARELPGPPVKLVVMKGAELVMVMTMTATRKSSPFRTSVDQLP